MAGQRLDRRCRGATGAGVREEREADTTHGEMRKELELRGKARGRRVGLEKKENDKRKMILVGRKNRVRKENQFWQKYSLNISFGGFDPLLTFVDPYKWVQRER